MKTMPTMQMLSKVLATSALALALVACGFVLLRAAEEAGPELPPRVEQPLRPAAEVGKPAQPAARDAGNQ